MSDVVRSTSVDPSVPSVDPSVLSVDKSVLSVDQKDFTTKSTGCDDGGTK